MFKKTKVFKGFKIIFRYLAKYKKDLVVLSILSVISALANGFVPYIAGRLFDAILKPAKIFIGEGKEIPLWLFFIISWFLIKLIAELVDWRNKIKRENIGNITYSDYMVMGHSHILEMPLSFHKNRKMGAVIQKINFAANWLSTIVSDVIINLSPQFLSILVALIISFNINKTLTLILFLAVLLYILILLKIVQPLAKIQKNMISIQSKSWGDVYDAIGNIQTVKQATAEKYEQKKLLKNFRIELVKIWNKIAVIWQGLSFYQGILIALTQLAVFLFSIYFIQKGKMTIGELIMFNGYAAMLFSPFVSLGHQWQSVQNGLIAIQDAEKILNQPKEIYNPAKAPVLSGIKGEIIFDNVVFKYHRKHGDILDGISFKVEPGEVVALVGESGVGKTTIIDLISGYYFPQKGKVLIDGHNVKNLNLKFLRSKIAVVPQEVVLFNDTIKKNIAYGKFSATDKEIKEAAEKSYANEFIESFPRKYNQVVGERGIKLSVGQKQRVAIARAILREPRILILDEPTSALDAKSEKFIQESLEKLMKGKTTFIIAHRLSTVRKADKILVIQDGKIAEQGKHEELIQIPNGVYRQFYELQIGLL